MIVKDFVMKVVGALRSFLRPEMSAEQVEVELQARADAKDEKLDWKRSVVDLLKTLDLPSDYAARKQLADELGHLGYSGMVGENIALHRALVAQVASHDIKLPPVDCD